MAMRPIARIIKAAKRAMRLWTCLLATIAVCATLAAAGAEEMPRYDPTGYCKRVGETVGGKSQWLTDACFEQEQGAYDKLKPNWGKVPAKTRRWCDQVARAGGRGSYVILEQCVDMEFYAKRKNDNSKFKF